MDARDAQSREGVRLSAVCGIVFAITFVAAIVLLGGLLGSFADSDETFSEYYESSSNRNGSALGGVLLFVSGIALLPFVGGLVRLLSRSRESAAAQLAVPLSYVASGLIIASAAAFSTVGMARIMADIFDEATPPFQGASIVVLPQLGYVLMVFAAWTQAVLLALAGSLIIRTRALPAAAGWLAIVCAAILLPGAFAIAPLLALPLWVLTAAVLMLRPATGRETVRDAGVAAEK